MIETNTHSHRVKGAVSWIAAAAIVGVTAAVAIVGTATSLNAGGAAELTLLFQGAVHGKIEDCGCKSRPLGGLAARAGLIDQVKEQAEHVLLLDAGNLFGMPGEEMRRQSAFLAQETAALGYRVVGVGPWDLNHGLDFLSDVDATTDLAFTSANLVRHGEPVLSPYEIVEQAGVRVGVISVCDPELPTAVRDELETSIGIGPPAEALARYLPELQEQTDVVILLSNLTSESTEALLLDLEGAGIDFAIEGHANVRYEKAKRIGSTTLLAANSQGKYLGQVDLTFADGRVQDTRLTMHAVDPKGPQRKDTAKRVRQFQDEVEELARR